MSQFDNDFYGNSAGGGFVSGSPYGSGSGSPGGIARRNGAAHSLTPCNCAQLLSATQMHSEAEWVIDGVEIGQVTLVGQVIEIQRQTTNMVYWIHDGTGRFEARHWTDSSTEDADDIWRNIPEHSTVRVMGSLKSYGSKRYLNATHIRLVHHADEFEFHTLETVFVAEIHKKGPPRTEGRANQPISNNIPDSSAYTAQSNGMVPMSQIEKLDPLPRKIVEFMHSQANNPEGVHVAAVARAIRGDPNAISDALDKLMDDGLVFTTINESHFSLSI